MGGWKGWITIAFVLFFEFIRLLCATSMPFTRSIIRIVFEYIPTQHESHFHSSDFGNILDLVICCYQASQKSSWDIVIGRWLRHLVKKCLH